MYKKTVLLTLAYITTLNAQSNPCRNLLYAHIFSPKYFKKIEHRHIEGLQKLLARYYNFAKIPTNINKTKINRYLNSLKRELPLELEWAMRAKKSTAKHIGNCLGHITNLQSFMEHQKIIGNKIQKNYAHFAIKYLTIVQKLLAPILLNIYKKKWRTKKDEAEMMRVKRREIVEKYIAPLKQRIEQINTTLIHKSPNHKNVELLKEKLNIEEQINTLETVI